MRLKLLHLSDFHLTLPGRRVYGLNPLAGLEQCLASIAEHHPDADLMVISGDLAHRGQREAYMALRALLSGLPFPVKLMLGNHDHRETFLRVFSDSPVNNDGYVQWTEDRPGAGLIFLDTNLPGSSKGRLGPKRRAWLSRRLQEAKAPVYLFMHHPPFTVHHPPMDLIGLEEPEAFTRTLAPYRDKLAHIFCGHIHRTMSGSWLGTGYSIVSGTNHQVWPFWPDHPVITGSHEEPSYNLAYLEPGLVSLGRHNFLGEPDTFPLTKDDTYQPHGHLRQGAMS